MMENMDMIDKMIELGMGATVAGQVISVMGKSLEQLRVPVVNHIASQSGDNVYYAVIEGKQAGPYTLSEFIDLLKSRKIAKETYVWKPGMTQWDLAENIDTLKPFV